MAKNNDSFDFFGIDQPSSPGGGAGGKETSYTAIFLAAITIFTLFFFAPAAFIALILNALFFRFSKKTYEGISLFLSAAALAASLLKFSYQALFQFAAIWRPVMPKVVSFAEYLLQDDVPFEITGETWLVFAIFTWFLTSLVFTIYRQLSKNWITHEKEHDKKEHYESDEYKKTFKNRSKILEQRQENYRNKSVEQIEEKPIFVGINTFKKDIVLPIVSFFTHCITQGTTGSGKTTLMYSIMEGATRVGVGSVFIDGKGDPKTAMDIEKIANRYNKKLHVFSDWTDLHFNPVRHGKPTAIKDRLIAMMDWSEQFYAKEAENNLQNIISFIQDYIKIEKTRKDSERPREQGKRLKMDLETIHRFLDYEEIGVYLFYEQSRDIIKQAESIRSNSTPADIVSQLKKKKESKTVAGKPLHEKYMQYFFKKDYLTYGDLEEISEMKGDQVKLIRGLRTQIELLLYSDLGDKFLESDDPEKNMDLMQIIKNGDIALFAFNANDYESFIKNLGRLVISDIAHIVTKLYQEKMFNPFSTFKGAFGFFDEFGAYANNKVIDILSRARSANFGAILGIQSKSDLMIDNIDMSSRIIDNVNLFFLGRSNDPDNAEYASKTAGTYADIDRTVMTENKLGPLSRFETQEERGTVRNVRKFWFDPDEIKDLPKYTFTMVDKTTDELEPVRDRLYIRDVMKGLDKAS